MVAAAAGAACTSGFLIKIDYAEKALWKRSAAAAGLTMAEYVRRAVRQVEAESRRDRRGAPARDRDQRGGRPHGEEARSHAGGHRTVARSGA